MDRLHESDEANAVCGRTLAALKVPEEWMVGVRRMCEDAAQLRATLASGLGPYDDMAAIFRPVSFSGERARQVDVTSD